MLVMTVPKDTREMKREEIVKVALINNVFVILTFLSPSDINECDDDESTAAYCKGGTYCVNKPGTYECESNNNNNNNNDDYICF